MTRFLNAMVRNQSKKLRHAKLDPVLDALQSGARVLDVGVWCAFPEPHPAENWLEKQDTGQGQLIAVGMECMSKFKAKYPNVWCVQANGTALPFKDNAVDIVAANAVLEHVHASIRGAFVGELTRIARRWAWLSIPDRYCPLEVHTRLPFVHWLPFWRSMMRVAGHLYWSKPENLNMLSKRTLHRLVHANTLSPGSWKIVRQSVMGIPVSLLATYTKQP